MSGGGSGDAVDPNIIISVGLIIIFVLLLIYVIGGAYLEKIHSPVGHETSIALILGLVVSAILWQVQGA